MYCFFLLLFVQNVVQQRLSICFLFCPFVSLPQAKRRTMHNLVKQLSLKFLIDCLRYDRTKVRSKALKAITSIFTVDRTILTPKLVEQVKSCLQDVSPSVREEALKLCGMALKQKDFFEIFYRNVLKALHDKGLCMHMIQVIFRPLFSVLNLLES